MKRWILATLLACALLLPGAIQARAEEPASGGSGWAAENTEQAVRTEKTAAGAEESEPEKEKAGAADVPEEKTDGAYAGEETFFAGDGFGTDAISDAENAEANRVFPESILTPEDRVFPESVLTQEDHVFSEPVLTQDGGSEEEFSGLTIDSVEEVDLADDGLPSAAAETAAAVEISERNFPDDRFRSYVSGLDSDGDGVLSVPEIEAVTGIDVKGKRIGSLKGIEFFVSLTKLNCSANQLAELDVSRNRSLTELDCSTNRLTALDVSPNGNLTKLNCANNKTGKLDVSRNPELTELNCGGNGLNSLDVSRNPKLTVLNCGNNELTVLDVSQNPELTALNCGDNKLGTVDVSRNPKLTELECYLNALTALDLSGNPGLTTLFCYENALTTLDVSGCAQIQTVSCGTNRLTELKIGEGAALIELNCENNELTSLDVSGYSKLRLVDCSRNQLTALTIRKPGDRNGTLNTIECQENALTSLDVSEAKALQFLICNDNELTELNLRGNIYLTWFDCTNNKIEALDLSQNKPNNRNKGLSQLFCGNNRLGALDVSQSTGLEILNCSDNQIRTLNVNGCKEMTGLDCENNLLESLDVSSNENLVHLLCGSNRLTKLDLSGNKNLEELVFSPNEKEVPVCTVGDIRRFDLAGLIGDGDLSRVTVVSKEAAPTEGKICFTGPLPETFVYEYDTKASSSLLLNPKITVTLKFTGEHTYRVVADEAPSCTEGGKGHRECTVCGYKDETVIGIEAAGHTYGEYAVTAEPTALSEGTETRVCGVCGETESRTIERLEATATLNVKKLVLKTKQTTEKLEVSGLQKGDYVTKWKSGNTKLVKVKGKGDLSRCKVTAKNKTGSTVITVTFASGLKKEIPVTVQKEEVETKKISGLKKKLSLVKGEKFTLTPVITPVTSTRKVEFQTSDPKIATVSAKGVVKALKKGRAKITVNSGNKKFTITLDVKKNDKK